MAGNNFCQPLLSARASLHNIHYASFKLTLRAVMDGCRLCQAATSGRVCMFWRGARCVIVGFSSSRGDGEVLAGLSLAFGFIA
jgi:hypothetical protein